MRAILQRALLAFLVVEAMAFSGRTTCRGALLEGKDMTVRLFHMTTPNDQPTGADSGLFTVGTGVELTGFGFQEFPPLPALVDIDVSDRQILITLVIDQPLAFLEDLIFADFFGTIPGSFKDKVATNPATNWAGFGDGRVQEAGDGIPVRLGGLQGLQGQFILLDVVPEPASIALLGCALPIGLLLRRLRCAQPNHYA